jgi:hypothetical protein
MFTPRNLAAQEHSSGKASGTDFETNAAAGDLSSGGKILRFPRYFVSDFLDFGNRLVYGRVTSPAV